MWKSSSLGIWGLAVAIYLKTFQWFRIYIPARSIHLQNFNSLWAVRTGYCWFYLSYGYPQPVFYWGLYRLSFLRYRCHLFLSIFENISSVKEVITRVCLLDFKSIHVPKSDLLHIHELCNWQFGDVVKCHTMRQPFLYTLLWIYKFAHIFPPLWSIFKYKRSFS